MSLYQLQQCVYDYLRTLEAVEAGSPGAHALDERL